MPESFIEAPLFRMLTPPSSSPRESHEIFMLLLARHEPVIPGYLRSLVSRPADVDELMPDVALVAWRKFSELHEPEAFPRWACVIARHEALRFRRDQRLASTRSRRRCGFEELLGRRRHTPTAPQLTHPSRASRPRTRPAANRKPRAITFL
jgi:DNA-directed RNA polymerase specialized sigma24 family protein